MESKGSSPSGAQLLAYHNEEDDGFSDNFVFHLYHEMNYIQTSNFFHYISNFILIIQTLIASFWLTSSHVWLWENNILDGFQSIIDFRIHKYEDAYYYYISGIVFFVLILIWSIYIFFHFQSMHCYQKIHLQISLFLLHFVLPIVSPVYGSFFSRSFIDLVNRRDPSSVIFFTIYFVIFCAIFIVGIMSFNFRAYSSVLPKCFFVEWIPGIRKLTFFILNLCTLGPIFSKLPIWCQFVFTLIISLLYLFSFLVLQMYPFFRSSMNFFFSIFDIYLSLQEIMLSFRIILTIYFPMLYVFVIPVCLAVISIPIYGYFFVQRNRKIVSFLSESESELNASEKAHYFDSAKFSNLFHVLPYLQIGIEKNLDYIVDLSFLYYLAARIPKKPILITIARIATFFPSETRFLSLLLEAIEKFDYLSINERYFLFQAKRIMSLRKYKNADATNYLYILHKTSKERIESIRGLWLEIIHSKGPISYTTFRYIYNTSRKMKNQFLDLISKSLDDYDAIDEYNYFLIEGLSDFSRSIDLEIRKRMIEKGVKMGVDYTFRSFVNYFPQYLTKEITDEQGNIIFNNFYEDNDSNSNLANDEDIKPIQLNLNSTEYYKKASNFVDSTISECRLRIAIQNSLNLTTFKNLKNFENLNIAQLLALIFAFLFFVIYLPYENKNSMRLIDCVDLLSYMSIDILLNSYYQSVQAALEEGKMPSGWHNNSLPMSDEDLNTVQSIYNNTNSIISIVDEMLNYYSLFVNSFSENPKISNYCLMLLEPNFQLSIFKDNQIFHTIDKLTFSQIIHYISSLSQKTASRSASPLFSHHLTDDRLTVAFNGIYLGQVLETLRRNLITAYNEVGSSQKTVNLAFGILMASGVFIIFLPLQIFLICSLRSSVTETINMLQKVNQETVAKSLLPIQLNQIPKPLAKGSYLLIFQGGSAFVISTILGILSVIVPVLILFFIPIINYNTLTSRIDCLVWHYLSSSRLIWGAMGISTNYVNLVINPNHYDILIDILNRTVTNLISAQSLLLMGSHNSSTIIGADKELNEHIFLDSCQQTSVNNSAFVDYIKCVSVDRAINYLEYLFIKSMNQFNDTVLDSPFYEDFIYEDYIDTLLLMDIKLINSIKDYQVLIVKFVNNSFEHIDQVIITIIIAGMVASILIFCGIFFGAIHSLRIAFEGIKQMIRFLPPSDIFNSQQLLNFIFMLNDQPFEVNGNAKQSQAQAILASIKDGVIAVNSSGIIEFVNRAFVNMSSYSKEHLVNQPLSSLFSDSPEPDLALDHNNCVQKLMNSIELMKNGFVEDKNSFDFHCKLENGSVLNAFVYVIGIEDRHEKCGECNDDSSDSLEDIKQGEYKKLKRFNSFLIVFHDISEEIRQKEKFSEIKAKSEILLKKLIPAQAYTEFEGPGIFSTNKATVIIAQLLDTVETVKTFPPHSVISLVNSYFDKFDEIAKNYPAVHNIYSTENLYVACCGLFDFQNNPSEQAVQAVNFALDILDQMMIVDRPVKTPFQIKLEINFGGPLYGCVLDYKVPQFNLHGLVLDQTMELIFDAEMNTVEISQSVKDLVENNKQFLIISMSDQNKRYHFYNIFNVIRLSGQS